MCFTHDSRTLGIRNFILRDACHSIQNNICPINSVVIIFPVSINIFITGNVSPSFVILRTFFIPSCNAHGTFKYATAIKSIKPLLIQGTISSSYGSIHIFFVFIKCCWTGKIGLFIQVLARECQRKSRG